MDSRQASPSRLGEASLRYMYVRPGVYQSAKGRGNSLPAAVKFAIWAQGSRVVVALDEAVAAPAAKRAAAAERRDILGDITKDMMN